jgi:hypothetical protein
MNERSKDFFLGQSGKGSSLIITLHVHANIRWSSRSKDELHPAVIKTMDKLFTRYDNDMDALVWWNYA